MTASGMAGMPAPAYRRGRGKAKAKAAPSASMRGEQPPLSDEERAASMLSAARKGIERGDKHPLVSICVAFAEVLVEHSSPGIYMALPSLFVEGFQMALILSRDHPQAAHDYLVAIDTFIKQSDTAGTSDERMAERIRTFVESHAAVQAVTSESQ